EDRAHVDRAAVREVRTLLVEAAERRHARSLVVHVRHYACLLVAVRRPDERPALGQHERLPPLEGDLGSGIVGGGTRAMAAGATGAERLGARALEGGERRRAIGD